MAEDRRFRAFVIEPDGTRTEIPDLYVESGVDAIRDAMTVAMERLAAARDEP